MLLVTQMPPTLLPLVMWLSKMIYNSWADSKKNRVLRQHLYSWVSERYILKQPKMFIWKTDKFWAQIFYKQVFHSWESLMGYSHKKHGANLHCAKDCLILGKISSIYGPSTKYWDKNNSKFDKVAPYVVLPTLRTLIQLPETSVHRKKNMSKGSVNIKTQASRYQ